MASREIAQAIHQAREEIQEARNEGKAGDTKGGAMGAAPVMTLLLMR